MTEPIPGLDNVVSTLIQKGVEWILSKVNNAFIASILFVVIIPILFMIVVRIVTVFTLLS